MRKTEKEWVPRNGHRDRPDHPWKKQVMQCDREDACEDCYRVRASLGILARIRRIE